MKHLRTFESSEEDLVKDLETLGMETMKGWLLSVQEYGYDEIFNWKYITIIAPNLGRAVQLFIELILPEIPDDFDVDEAEESGWGYAEDQFGTNEQGGFEILQGWQDLKPRSTKEELDFFFESNPMMAIRDLEKVFSNARQVLADNPIGNI